MGSGMSTTVPFSWLVGSGHGRYTCAHCGIPSWNLLRGGEFADWASACAEIEIGRRIAEGRKIREAQLANGATA
jgi:hypothetical protein